MQILQIPLQICAGTCSICALLCSHDHLFLAYTSFDQPSLYSPVTHFVRNLLSVVPVVAYYLIATFNVRDHPWYYTGSVYL